MSNSKATAMALPLNIKIMTLEYFLQKITRHSVSKFSSLLSRCHINIFMVKKV